MTIIEALKQLRNDLRAWVAINLDTKVDKVKGKGLSTNDYTDADKNKLANLSNALVYRGISETELSDGSTTNPITILGESHTAESGCVVFYNNKEFVWNGSAWEELGDLSGVDFNGYATEQWVKDQKYLTEETLPETVTEDTVAGWGFTKNTGTVTSVKINDTSISPTNGEVNLGTVVIDAEMSSTATSPSVSKGVLTIPIVGGTDGATFTPSVAIDGTLSWTNDKNLTNPPSVNIKGSNGDSVTNAEPGLSYDEAGYTSTPITFTVGTTQLGPVTIKAKHGNVGKSISSVTRKSGEGKAGTTDIYSVKVDTTEVGTFNVYQGKDFEYQDFTAEQLSALQGPKGTGISSITGPVSNGKIDTYTIHYTDTSTTSSFTVTNGSDGTGVTILGNYETEAALKTEHPTGDLGDAYLVNGDLYVWSQTKNDWINVGNIQGPPGDPGKEIAAISSDASLTSGYTTTTVTVTYDDNTSNTFKVNAKNGGLDSHTHPFTPEGTNSNTVAGGTVTGSFTGSEVTTSQSTSNVSVSNSDHIHSINASTSTTSVASNSHTHTANAADSELSVSVATSAHKHTVSVTGEVGSSFSGTSATIAKTATAGESVASALHTHSIDITGSVSSTFTGSEVASSNSGPSYSYEAGVLTINFGHTHNVTAAGGVNTTFTGNTVNSGTPSATTTVAANAHTHSYTPAGTVTSLLNNVSATVEASDTNASVTKSDHTHTVAATTSYTDVASTGHVHTMEAATSSESVAKSTHTHTVTAAGSLTDLTFTGTEHTHTFTGTAGVTGNPS